MGKGLRGREGEIEDGCERGGFHASLVALEIHARLIVTVSAIIDDQDLYLMYVARFGDLNCFDE